MSDRDEHQTVRKLPSFGALTAERADVHLVWTDADGARTQRVTEPSTIGFAPEMAIRIADPTVSRIHAEITWREGSAWVRDLGSRNGTFVDGVQVDAARLVDGSVLRVGSTDVRVRVAAGVVPIWPVDHFGPLLGESEPMRELFHRLARMARTESTVLVLGETGSGKELVARAIHEASPRAKGPFVTVDCTSIPETLFESELFGHAKGSFTGAQTAREGAIEAASGGTVFLDEIGELPIAIQPKLLRAIESRTIKRVGEASHRAVDVRFVAATHRDLASMVNAGAFREDLYFRLAVLLVSVPPLRARAGDIPLLVSRLAPPGSAPFTPAVLAQIAALPWLGNVRELRNFVERAAALGPEEALAASPSSPGMVSPIGRPTDLPAPDIDRPFKDVRDEWLAHLEREYLRGWLARTKGNVTGVAEAVGLDRTYIHRLMKKHDLVR